MIKLLILLVIHFQIGKLVDPSDDIDRNGTQLIESRGFQSEVHTVQTTDGYIVTMFRIVNPYWTAKTKRSVLMQHCFLGSADYWMLNTPGQLNSNGTYVEVTGVATDCSAINVTGNTIPFVLSACGYDIWLGNNRGNRYSKEHVNYTQNDEEYWRFSMDELSNDALAMVNYIRNETSSETIAYLGHSLGTTQMIQLLTENQEVNKIIKPFIALTPVAYLGHCTSLLRTGQLIEPVFENTPGAMLVLPAQRWQKVGNFLGNACDIPGFASICETFVLILTGLTPNYLDNKSEYYGARLAHIPDDSSMMVAAQFAQRARTNLFNKYDFKANNNEVYGQSSPPKYNISSISSHNIVFMSGLNDNLADPTDVEHLKDDMRVELYEDYTVANYGHLDFVWADNTGTLVVPKLLTVLDQFN